MAVTFVGVGDPHFDGKLSKFIPNLNQLIAKEITKAIEYAVRNGIGIVVLYGDICDVTRFSDEAYLILLRLFKSYPDLKFILITGNHDRASNEVHSLLVVKEMIQLEMLTNVIVIDRPRTLFKNSGTPVRFLPWPHKDTDAECLNVIHIEAAGTHWDHGKVADSDFVTEHVCVAGHLHTRQRTRNTYYSGTMYQTNFGEKPKKYFHHVYWNGPDDYKIKHIPTVPEFTLINHVVNEESDIALIEADPSKLYKVFVKKGVVLDSDAFGKLPNVLRVNSFATEKQLTSMLHEDLEVQDLSQGAVVSVEDSLKSWLTGAGLEDGLRKRTWKKFLDIRSKSGDVNA